MLASACIGLILEPMRGYYGAFRRDLPSMHAADTDRLRFRDSDIENDFALTDMYLLVTSSGRRMIVTIERNYCWVYTCEATSFKTADKAVTTSGRRQGRQRLK